MESTLNLILHHGGRLYDDGAVQYEGGQYCVWEDIDCDTLNQFLLEGMAKAHGYGSFKGIWWRNTQVTDVEMELIKIDGDAHIRDIIICAKYNGGDIEIFFEHHDEDLFLNTEPLQVILGDKIPVIEPRVVDIASDEDDDHILDMCGIRGAEVGADVEVDETVLGGEGLDDANIVDEPDVGADVEPDEPEVGADDVEFEYRDSGAVGADGTVQGEPTQEDIDVVVADI